jgi:hypothetical protein
MALRRVNKNYNKYSKHHRVIWLQTATVFWIGGRNISLSYGMYIGLIMLGRHTYIRATVA